VVSIGPENEFQQFVYENAFNTNFFEDNQVLVKPYGYPRYTTNKIRICTVSKHCGPWSGETVIYKWPEQTPGKQQFDKNGFFYL
jgi:hypothetical protein